MKHIFLALLLCFSLAASAQNKNKKTQTMPDMSKHLTQSWVQGKMSDQKTVVAADPSRAGWYYLDMAAGGKVVFKGTFDCGFGATREGTWSYNPASNTVVFKFSKKAGYDNNAGSEKINETEVYKVEKATAKELILKPTQGDQKQTLVLIKNEEGK